MSESDSFISEVSEEVRRDKLYAFLRRWGWLLGLAVLLIVGGTGAIEWRKHAREEAARQTGDEIRAALSEPDPAARAEALAPLTLGGEGAAIVARFARAGSLAESGETEAAGGALAEIAEDPEAAAIYKDLARLQRVMLLGDGLDASERLATLEGLTEPGAPFRALALEQRTIVRLETGDVPGAVADLETVLETPGASEAVRGRAQQLLIALGGGSAGEDAASEDAAGEDADATDTDTEAAAPTPADG